MPQGSCLGANNFIAYSAPIEDVLKDKPVDLSGYVDDHSLLKSFKPSEHGAETGAILMLKNAITNIGMWMSQMRLKLNQDKTEFIMFGYRKQLTKYNTSTIDLDGNLINLSSDVKYLGGSLDSNLNMKKHIRAACRKAMANFYRSRSIKPFRNRQAAETLLLGLCISHLD